MQPHPAEIARQQTVLRLTRQLLYAYGAAVIGLFGPAMLRVGGLEIIPHAVQPYLSGGLLAVMTILLVAWFLRMVQLGEYSREHGLHFALIPALLDGRYETESGAVGRRAQPRISPLGALAADVSGCVDRLNREGRPHLAFSVEAALREAEGLATALLRWPPPTDDARGSTARSAIGRFEEHVQQLRVVPGLLDEAAHTSFAERFEGDLVNLRAAADALRAPASPPPAAPPA